MACERHGCDQPIAPGGTRFCSLACYNLARKVERPLCEYCRQTRVRHKRQRFCSFSCAARGLRSADVLRGQKLVAKANAARRAKFLERVRTICREEVAGFIAAGLSEQHALKLAARCYAHGYKRGQNNVHQRYKTLLGPNGVVLLRDVA